MQRHLTHWGFWDTVKKDALSLDNKYSSLYQKISLCVMCMYMYEYMYIWYRMAKWNQPLYKV